MSARPDGPVVQGGAQVRKDGRAERLVRVPVPVFNEASERVWWDTGKY